MSDWWIPNCEKEDHLASKGCVMCGPVDGICSEARLYVKHNPNRMLTHDKKDLYLTLFFQALT